MQNDLISRNALIAEHCDGCDAFAKGLCDHDVCGTALLIMEAPAVDAVEVVRCKDCKYYDYGNRFPDIKFCCRLKDKDGEIARYNYSDEDFCSYGERRADDGH